MNPKNAYDAAQIHAALHQAETAAFSTFRDGAINSRFMIFACDEALRHFFLMTHRETDKVGEVSANANATACVLAIPEGGKLEDSCEATVAGKVTVSDDIDCPWVQEGLRRLAEKSPPVKALLDGGSLGPYRVLRLDSDSVVFRTYRDAVSNVPKTVLRFAP